MIIRIVLKFFCNSQFGPLVHLGRGEPACFCVVYRDCFAEAEGFAYLLCVWFCSGEECDVQ